MQMELKKIFRTGQKPWLLEYRAHNYVIMTAVAFAVFTDVFLYGIIIPIAPYVLQERLGVAPGSVQHGVSVALLAYAAGLLAASPVFGYLADIFQDRRLFMLIGLFSLVGSTLMLCLARVLWLFICGRLVQGMSAACVWTVGLALVTDSFEEDKIGMVMGIISTAMSLGVFMGPLLGGIIYDRAGYYAVFAVVFAVIGADVVLRLFMLEKKAVREYEGRDRDAAVVIKKFGVPAGIRLLANGRMLNVFFIAVIIAWILSGIESILPLHTETVFHFSSLGSGLVFLPIAITSLIGPLVGFWVDKHGPRWPLSLGLVLACPFLVLLRLPHDSSTGQVVLLFAILALLGLSVALLLPPSMAEISTCVTAAEQKRPGIFGSGGAYGQAFGLFNLAYSAGSVFGPLEVGFVADAEGWNTATWTLGMISGVSAIPALLFTGGYVFTKKAAAEDVDNVGEVEPVGTEKDEEA